MAEARRAQLERLLVMYGQTDPAAVQYICDSALESAVLALRMVVIVPDECETDLCAACAHRRAG